MKSALTIIGALLFSYSVLSSSLIADSLSASLTYRTDVEESILKNFLNQDSTDFFPVFHAVGFDGTSGDISSIRKELYAFISEYQNQEFLVSKNSKKAKVLFKDTHQRFFKKYQLEAVFKEVFSDGVYNCATASAVFAIIFEELDFEYEIRLLPDHVYLVLFPKTDAIKIETTNPMRGYLNIDEKAKKEYVKFLKDNKLISEDEYNTKSVVELFDEFYSKDQVIDIRQLIGVQYYNYALSFFNQQKWEEAFQEFEKAKLFFKDARVDFLLLASLNNYFITTNNVDFKEVKYLVKMVNYNLIESTTKNFLAYYALYLQQHLFDKGQEKEVLETNTYISNNLRDSLVKSEVNYISNFEIGRYYINKGNYVESNRYFEKAIAIKPNNVDAQAAFIQTLISRLDNTSLDKSIALIEESARKYPELQSNLQFAQLVSNSYLFSAIQLLNYNKINEGIQKIDAFEEHLSNHNGLSVNNELVGEAYTTAAVSYFSKGQYSKAKDIINRGLTIAPNSYELNRALDSF